jgi:hypothetical protein
MSSIVVTHSVCTIAFTAACFGANSPALTSRENGARNFNDAASHTQYRTAARCLFSARVSSQAATPKTVDCHR